MTLFDTMPATQDYYVTSSHMKSWETVCIPTLHSAFLGLQSFRDQSCVLEVAMKALAACQLSRRSFREQRTGPLRLPRSLPMPDSDHEVLRISPMEPPCEKSGNIAPLLLCSEWHWL